MEALAGGKIVLIVSVGGWVRRQGQENIDMLNLKESGLLLKL